MSLINKMVIPGFSAHYSLKKENERAIVPAQIIPEPSPTPLPPGWEKWLKTEIPGKEVLCDPSCRRECYDEIRQICGGDGECRTELERDCYFRCCPRQIHGY